MNKLTSFLVVLCIVFLTFLLSSNAYARELPGCRDAYNTLGRAGQLGNAKTLVSTNCAILYNRGWLLPQNGGISNRSVCVPAWNNTVQSSTINSAKFLVTHNCPVMYRQGWLR